MKKIFFVLALVTLSVSVSANVVYCDPASEIEGGFAEDWDNAVSPSVMPLTLSGMYPGDTLVIKGGVISIKSLTDLWEITKGITVIGGFDPALEGNDLTMPTYPSATPTIFDGDVNGNGRPDAGDAEALIRVNLKDNVDQVCTLQGIDMRNTYHYVQGESTSDLDTYMAKTAALRLICGTVFVKNCEIYNNFTGNRGSQSVTVVGAKAHFIDCDIHNGVSESRGGLIRTRDYFPNPKDEKDNPIHPSTVIERCALHHGSALAGRKINAAGTYGGAIHASTGEIFAINSTFVLDSCYSKGGALRGNKAGITLISCTFGQNFGVRADTADSKQYSYGSSIGLDGDVPVRFMNTIVLDDKDMGDKRTAPIYTDGNTVTADQFFISNDHNILGTIYIYVNGGRISSDELTALMKANDQFNVNKNNDFTAIFGDVYTNLKNNGGFAKSILPLKMQNGATVEELVDYAYEECPDWTEVDATVDQRGWKRNENVTCVGAAAYEAEEPSALPEVQNAQCTMHNAMYNVLGQSVDENYRGIVIYKGQKYLLQ